MRYHDERFARHARFRYFALNSILRWRALSIGQAFVRRNPDEKNISLQELRDMFAKDKDILSKSIMRIGYTLPGTPAFWQSRKRELVALIEQIGALPTIFFTLSAADFHWPELHALMDGYKSKSEAVSENPLKCVWFFHQKVSLLLKRILPQLGLQDYWGRFEFQHRESIHFHGLAWLLNAPDVSKLLEGTEADASSAVTYFDSIVTAWNPIVEQSVSIQSYRIGCNPSKVPLSQVVDVDADYRDLLMTCQRHTVCTSATCLRKKGAVMVCRYDYPKTLEVASRLAVETDETGDVELKFVPRRNDERLNVHNRFLLQLHRANIDVQAIVSKKKVVSYLTKYVTKAEHSSRGLIALSNALINSLTPIHPGLKLAQKLLMRVVGDRDYSAQETVNILMERPLVLHSRQIVHLSLKADRRLCADEQNDSVTVPNEVERYFVRPPEFNNVSLLEYTKRYYRNARGMISSRKKDAVVVVHPHLKNDPDSPLFEDFCMYYLLQHKPVRHMTDLKGTSDCYRNAYESFLSAFRQEDLLLHDTDDVPDAVNVDLDQDSSEELLDVDGDGKRCSRLQDDWMILCGDRCTMAATCCPEVDWTVTFQQNPQYMGAKEFYDNRFEVPVSTNSCDRVNPDCLNKMQQLIYNRIIDHTTASAHALSPLRMIICGTAGTGKSYLIKCLQGTLQKSCAVMAPTGVAALAINGSTIHSLLSIPVGCIMSPLEGDQLRGLQECMVGVQYFILDEMSMVGQNLLAKIDARLRQAFPDGADCWFGNKSMILIGDFGQLAPVCDTPLYKFRSGSCALTVGALAYFSFLTAGTLNESVRQKSDMRFRKLLLRLRNAALTIEDYRLLSSRFKGQVKNEERFLNAVRLFPTVDKVTDHNMETLMEMQQSIATIAAVHNCSEAAKAPLDIAGGLAKQVMLALGAKVMLTANVWIQAGLCNGSLAVVRDIVYSTDQPPALPLFVICEFETYKGPSFLNMDRCFPIFPIQRSFDIGGLRCTRKNVPLVLAWGVTVHKAQGLTLPRCFVDLGDSEFTTGLSFVALSRVRSIQDLLIAPFSFDRLQKFAYSKSLQLRIAEDCRLQTMSKSLMCSNANLFVDDTAIDLGY